MKKNPQHNFNDIFFARERRKEGYKDVIYGEKGEKLHNHLGLKEDGTEHFHEVRRPEIRIAWESASIINVGYSYL